MRQIQQNCLLANPQDRISIERVVDILENFFNLKEKVKDELKLKEYFEDQSVGQSLKHQWKMAKKLHECIHDALYFTDSNYIWRCFLIGCIRHWNLHHAIRWWILLL